jgi:gluconate 2-dehydrogenase gamma chain
MDTDVDSRRSFLRSAGGVLTAVWLSANRSGIAAAALHAGRAAAAPTPLGFEWLSVQEGADVAAVAAQIVPSGATPGAHEAHVVYFIDRALATFFSDGAPAFRTGLAEFQSVFRASHPAIVTFNAANPDEQMSFLKSVEQTAFFANLRVLTVLGMFSAPQYAGNYSGTGWRLLGFEDQHVFEPPFGYYDAHYAGFVPYGSESKS